MMKLIKLINGILMLILVVSCSRIKPKEHKLEGNVFGTSFHITYLDEKDMNYAIQVDSLFKKVNKSLSTYDPTSDISLINKGDTCIVVDSYFEEVFNKADRIYKETDGVFDPTIGVLVNAWGFGPEKSIENLDAKKIQDLLKLVGYNKVVLHKGNIIKEDSEIFLDYNAIAKGFGVDVISRFLEGNGIHNYMVEIGGEVRVRGRNSESSFWRIGIEKPNFNGTRALQYIVKLENESMATSGNYRKFMIDPVTGEKFVHTIDTKTGYTAKRKLLSASVIGELDCADADGYATAFMAMGLEETKTFVKSRNDLKVYLIYLDAHGKTQTYANFPILD